MWTTKQFVFTSSRYVDLVYCWCMILADLGFYPLHEFYQHNYKILGFITAKCTLVDVEVIPWTAPWTHSHLQAFFKLSSKELVLVKLFFFVVLWLWSDTRTHALPLSLEGLPRLFIISWNFLPLTTQTWKHFTSKPRLVSPLCVMCTWKGRGTRSSP